MKTMTPPRIDPQVVALLQARARRARSEAVGNFLLQLFHKLSPRFDFRLRDLHWG
jgi:hypothetical protein